MDILADIDRNKAAPTAAREWADGAEGAQQLAAIDMGSNSFRLEIGRLQGGRYKRQQYLKETVRLGAGLNDEGELSEEATQRGLACLQRFAQQLQLFDRRHVRAVATQTLREAHNRDSFLQRAQAQLGHAIEIISGREEARLIYTGVHQLQPSDQPRLVVDIGGRSTEMILGSGAQPVVAESFAVGCVGLSMRFFADGRITADAFNAAQVAAGAELEEGLQAFSRSRWQEALGSSGTAGAVSQLLAAQGVTDGSITQESLRWCMLRCLDAGHVDALSFAGLKPERRAVLPAGLAILYTLMVHFDVDRLLPAKGALRQGVIFDLQRRLQAAQEAHLDAPADRLPAHLPISAAASRPEAGQDGHHDSGKAARAERRIRHRPTDIRDATVATMQHRFGVDLAQAGRVAHVAWRLFVAAQPDADAQARQDLLWACALHEMGLAVSHHDHHRHSAYLLANADAAGFSQNQQRRLADLALAQRGGLRKMQAALAEPEFAWQALALRLAVIKCHARDEVDDQAWQLRGPGKAQPSKAQLNFSAGWAREHPRTLFLLTEEAATWARSGPLQLVLAPQP